MAPDREGAGVGLLLTDHHPEQGRLAGPVRADHPHDSAGGEQERQVVDQQAVAVTLGQALGVDHPVAQPGTGGYGDLELVRPALGGLGLRHEVVVGVDAGLPLGLAGPGRHPDPLELALKRLLAAGVGPLLPGQTVLLLFEPGGVIPFPRDAAPPVELEDPAGHVVEEVPVVGHGDHGAGVVLQGSLQPGHRFGVEMVGGFVEKEEIGLGEQQAAQRDPTTLSTGQGGDIGIAGRAPEGVHGDLEGPLQVPRTGGIDLVLEFGLLAEELVEVGVRLAEGRAHLVVAVDHGLRLARPVRDVPEDILVGVEFRLLGEETDGETRGQARLAREVVILTRHDLEQGGLAGAIASDHADLGTRIEGEVDTFQDLAIGRIEAPQVAHGEDVLGSHTRQCASPTGTLVHQSAARRSTNRGTAETVSSAMGVAAATNQVVGGVPDADGLASLGRWAASAVPTPHTAAMPCPWTVGRTRIGARRDPRRLGCPRHLGYPGRAGSDRPRDDGAPRTGSRAWRRRRFVDRCRRGDDRGN